MKPHDTISCPVSAYIPFLLEQAQLKNQRTLLVLKNEQLASYQAQLASFFAPSIKTIHIPEMDMGPFEPIAPCKTILAQRMRGLYDITHCPPPLLIVSAKTFCERMAPRTFFEAHQHVLKTGETCDFDGLVTLLTNLGYSRTQTVVAYGEFALRGDIVDLYSPAYENPIRLDFFGDTLERICTFDPLSQRRQEDQQQCYIIPLTMTLITEDTVKAFETRCTQGFPDESDYGHFAQRMKTGQTWLGMENALPLFFPDRCPPLTALYDPTQIYVDGPLEPLIEAYERDLTTGLSHLTQTPNTFGTFMAKIPLDQRFSFEGSVALPTHHFMPFSSPEEVNKTYKPLRPLVQDETFAQTRFDLFLKRLEDHERLKQQVVISCHTDISLQRIHHLLHEQDIQETYIHVVLGPLNTGFEHQDTVYYTEQDIFGAKISRTPPKKRTSESIFRELAYFQAGEYVVHKDHGIGQYEGLELVSIGGSSHDCLKLTYYGGDRLFLPVENIDLVSRYGAVEGEMACDKLGAVSWQNRQARVKKKIQDIAAKLIATAAARQLEQGEIYQTATGAFDTFCASFPYPETNDQLSAIEDVLSDLQSGRPMDRLICGDVGFGKTEVALRAAFVVALTGAQVAIIAPTTLLARQHGLNFKSRFEPFGLKVATLSRLSGPKETREIISGLKDGSIHVVIATHAIFSKQVEFSHLGMMIIDEEHHFGVAQKEKLKASHPHAHILTMTATPIPRTLHMALSGVRQMSLIATPPVDRLAVKTYVCPFDAITLREAILRELGRQGQVFYVSPRLEDLEKIQITLSDLVPEATVRIAHGQMAPKDLENVMASFCNREFHILLSTSIVESGIDLPWANTIIIHRADLFGMAQLYQLRGRVGRSQTQGYAYLLLPHYEINAKAMRRLSLLESLDALGAGFTLASHDMDIRGVGNLVGSEQSGHIREVGVELYQAMLNDAIQAQLQRTGEQNAMPLAPETFSPQLNLGLPISIPESYVADKGLRLSLYRRAGSLVDEAAINDFGQELVDRFGAMPLEVSYFLETLRLKNICLQAGVSKIDVGPKGAVISFHNNQFENVTGLLTWVEEQRGLVRLRPDHKISLSYAWPPDETRLRGLMGVVGALRGLITQAYGNRSNPHFHSTHYHP